MGRNKLKDVFSTKPPQPEIEVVFRDAEAQKEFEEAMYRAWENGAPENVEGIKGVIAYDSSCNRRMPFLFSDNIEGFMVGPCSEKQVLEISTPKGTEKVSLECFASSKRVVYRTSKEAIFFQEFIISGEEKCTYTPRIQKEYAQSVSQLADSYCTAIGLLDYFLPDDSLNDPAEAEQLRGTKKALRFTYRFYRQLCALEEVLQMSVKPTDVEASIDELAKINELYLLLVKKVPLHFDGQLNATEKTGVNLDNTDTPLEVGKEILITFYREQDVCVCGLFIHLYFVNILKHAVIKRIVNEDKQVRLLYGDTDSKPMQLFFTAFLTEQEAVEEHMHAKDKEAEYTQALTASEYFYTDNKLCEP